ncbi:MAG: hypothetical protein RH917_12665 [Lacipirellulaceae bacterium]
MSTCYLRRRLRLYLVTMTLVGWAFATPASSLAHVGLDSPNGGETLTAGETFTIDWTNLITHNTTGYNLWYSLDSEHGPWEDIVNGVDPGDLVDGFQLSFDWEVPSISDESVWVRVQQENGGESYYDVSDNSFSILTANDPLDFNGDGTVNSGDLINWTSGYGLGTGAASSDGDGDADGDVDGADFIAWQGDAQPGTANLAAVPEPATLISAFVSCLLLAVHRVRV